MTLTLQEWRSHDSDSLKNWGVRGSHQSHTPRGPPKIFLLAVPRFSASAQSASALALSSSLIINGARQRQSEAEFTACGGHAAHAEEAGRGCRPLPPLHVPGAFWDKCPAADKEKSYKCLVREFAALHKFGGGQPPSAAFEVQEMGEKGTGSLELGVASGEVFWITYPQPALGYYYAGAGLPPSHL